MSRPPPRISAKQHEALMRFFAPHTMPPRRPTLDMPVSLLPLTTASTAEHQGDATAGNGPLTDPWKA
jgi:hypothetical protein